MSFTIDASRNLTDQDFEDAAILTAAAFGREADEHNYQDTKEHLLAAEDLYLARANGNGDLIGFGAYRRLLWQGSC